MIKFIICDDNQDALDKANQAVTKIMMKYETEYKVYKYTKYNSELKKLIQEDEGNTKIYILDIELPRISGLEIASEIREEDDKSLIIFVTAHSECKNDIFYSRLQAIDFISKYHRYQERLEETIEHILTRIYREKALEFTYNHTFNRVLYKEITYIEKMSSQNKCIIHLLNKEEKYMTIPIAKLYVMLKPAFYQTHKSCIVNKENIKKIDFTNQIIYFKNGDKIDLLTPGAKKGLREYVEDF